MSKEPIHILSLGAGVQSSTLALMAAHGEIGPMPTAAIFADTQAEPASVYKWLDWLEEQLPYPVYRVTAGSLTEKITRVHTNQKTGNAYYDSMIPAYSENANGGISITGRHCTAKFKIIPVIKEARRLGGIKHGQKTVGVIQWIGISLDEVGRMKPSREPWLESRWPLIDKRMSRYDCLRWMKTKGYPEPPRSACVYCPFKSDAEWRRMRDDEPLEFASAVETERGMQLVQSSVSTVGKRQGKVFLHNSLVPLDQVDFSTDEDHGQQVLFNNECAGMCGV